MWKTTSFSHSLFQDGGGGVRENIICFLILRHPDIPKNVPVFWKLFSHRSANQDKPARMAGSKQGGQSVLDGIF